MAHDATVEYDVAILGAGFSGTSLAINLARLSGAPLRVLLVGDRQTFGRGAAYSTKQDVHLLNVPAAKMSALADEPSSFVDWLIDSGSVDRQAAADRDALGESFVPRRIYGEYLGTLVERTQVTPRKERAAGITRQATGFAIRFESGESVNTRLAVLALGNPPPGTPRALASISGSPAFIQNPWDYDAIAAIPPDADVMIIGTGLTMVDVVLTLTEHGHRGPIRAFSRRGLAPRVHRKEERAFRGSTDGLPRDLRELVRWMRETSERFESEGGDWRSVIDSIRPVTQQLWRGFSLEQKRSFQRHVQSFWGVHRHRIAPVVGATLETVRNTGQLSITRGSVLRSSDEDGLLTVVLREGSGERTYNPCVVVNCTGPGGWFAAGSSPLASSARDHGLVRPDPLGAGLDFVTETAQTIGADGQPVPGLFTMGPPCKGKLWEITAVPDLRVQSHELAGRLVTELSGLD